MRPMGWLYLVVPLTVIMLVLTPALVIPLANGRRKFLLDMRREEARIAEARARELELRQRRAELEYREALLELERFDRRNGAGPATTGSPGARAGPADDPAADPTVPYRPDRPAGADPPPGPDDPPARPA